MSSTLAQRVKERMEALGLSNAQLARMAKVSQPTSFNWASGKTKSLKGEPLLRAAHALGVTPQWLATGCGDKLSAYVTAEPEPPPRVREDLARYQTKEEPDPSAQAAELVRRMPPAVASEAIAYLRWLSSRHTPPPT